MRIYLVGFMSSGKSTIGYQLAKNLRIPFLDTDRQVAALENATVAKIFETKGESYFRQKEQEVLHATFDVPQLVVATGGGTPCFYDNMSQMRKFGFTFYLELSLQKIIYRITNTPKERPLVSGKSPEELELVVNELFDMREKYYKSAHYVVDAANKNAVHYISRIMSGYMY